MIDWGLIAILAVGILLGAIVASAEFRRKFFVGFRKFLGGVGSGSGRRREEREREPEKRQVNRRYVRTVKLVRCPKCEGTGRVRVEPPGILDKRLFQGKLVICPECKGEGEVEE